MTEKTIYIHQQAPKKPSLGAPCNGCGVCCAAEPCPVSRLFLGTKTQVCKALEWHAQEKRYFCGMVLHPQQFLNWLPAWMVSPASRCFKRWIAADWKCDSDAIL